MNTTTDIRPRRKLRPLRLRLTLLTAAIAMTFLNLQAGMVLNTLYSFGVPANGAVPLGALVQGNNGSFNGTAQSGETYNAKAVFNISSNGIFTNLYSFGWAVGDGEGTKRRADSWQRRLLLRNDGVRCHGQLRNCVQAQRERHVDYKRFHKSVTKNLILDYQRLANIAEPYETGCSIYSFTNGAYGCDPNGLAQGSDRAYGT
jgi:hypothetical protein